MPDNFFNWITVIGVIATCIGTITAIVQAQKASKASKASELSANHSEQYAEASKKSADSARQILKDTINRRELDRHSQKLREIRDILSGKYTRNYNPRGSKLDKDIDELNRLLNEFSGETIFTTYQNQIDLILSSVHQLNLKKDPTSIEIDIRGVVTKINQLLRSIDGAIKDGE